MVEEWSAAQDNALLLLIKIAKQANDEGRALVSKAGLMRFLRKKSHRPVTKALAQLVKLGELKISEGRANKWHGLEVTIKVHKLDKRRFEHEAKRHAAAAARRERAKPLPQGFGVTSSMRAWAEQNAPLVMPELATLDFVGWARSVEARFFDAEDSWRKFMLRRQEWAVEAAERRAARESRETQPKRKRTAPGATVGTVQPDMPVAPPDEAFVESLAQMGLWHIVESLVANVTADSTDLQPYQVRAFDLLAARAAEARM